MNLPILPAKNNRQLIENQVRLPLCEGDKKASQADVVGGSSKLHMRKGKERTVSTSRPPETACARIP